jgi:hypothetical protein
VKLLYAIAFVLFPLAAPAQTPDASLLTALCHDDYFEDTAGECESLVAGEDRTMEAILARYGEIINSDADDESIFYLTDPEEVPVGAIRPWQVTPSDNAITRDDDDWTADLNNKENTIAAQIITIESSHEMVSRSSPIPMRSQRMAPLQRASRPVRVYSPTKIARWIEPQTLALLTAAGSREDTAGSSHVSPHVMSPVPLASSSDQDLHFVLCDFGHYGRAYVETDPTKADASTIVRSLLQGQYGRPLRVLALNTEEGWVQDVSQLIARKVRAVAHGEKQELTDGTRAFIDAHTEPADQQVLPLW